MKTKLIILGLVLIISLGLCVMAFRRFIPAANDEIIIEQPREIHIQERMIVVHVSGAVRREGVYKLKSSDRIVDAIGVAGGASVNADLSLLNLAEKVKDGQKIMVPARVSRNSAGKQGSGTSINNASEKDLCKVPGVGKSTAQRIIAGRPYGKLKDLMKVKGIGKGKFKKIEPSISL